MKHTSITQSEAKTPPHVLVCILNWNRWKDTIECLESIYRISYPDYRVIVCDNGSTDGSVERIKAWAEGRLDTEVPEDHPLWHLSHPSVEKPIPYVEYEREEAENGGRREEDPPLVLVQTGANLGFAGGNNVGLRYALARDDCSYVWLLNNDTVIERDALSHLVQRMGNKPNAAMCGSTLLYYWKPETIEALGGGHYNRWLALPRHIGVNKPIESEMNPEKVEREIDYLVGASILVPVSVLRDVGLMSEDYFLYFEDLDWSICAKKRHTLAYSAESRVYHKCGGSTANGHSNKEKSIIIDYYFIKNRLTITRKFCRIALPTVYFGLLLSLLNRVRRRQWDRIRMILRIIRGKQEKELW